MTAPWIPADPTSAPGPRPSPRRRPRPSPRTRSRLERGGPVLLLALGLAGCRGSGGAELAPAAPGLAAKPGWLTFACVERGCDTTLTASITVVGSRPLAIERLALSDSTRSDVTFSARRRIPFVLKPGEVAPIAVRDRPDGDPRRGDLSLLVDFADAEEKELTARVPPGELAIPLVRRLVGEAVLGAGPPMLNFGPVSPGSAATLPITLRNDGTGNVGLVISALESSVPEISAGPIPPGAIPAGGSVQVPIVYAPSGPSYASGLLTVVPASPGAQPLEIELRGTSLEGPAIALPRQSVDFGSVGTMTSTAVLLPIENHGGSGLRIQAIEVSDPAVVVTLPHSATTAAVAPLAAVPLQVALATQSAGIVAGQLRIHSNDPAQPVVEVPISATVVQPKLSVDPAMIAFGTVPQGWALTRTIHLENTGYGDLVIKDVAFALGSSALFTLATLPPMPSTLGHGEKLAFDVQFRAEVQADFAANLAISSNDAETPYREVPLGATAASCQVGCPVPNGTPSCTKGACAIGSCNSGYYDVDGDAGNGCECQGLGGAGAFCESGTDLGVFSDSGHRASYTGNLPTSGDAAVLKFFGRDDFQWFHDGYNVRVSVQSSDPGIKVCVDRHETTAPSDQCVLENEECPTDLQYSHGGSALHDDSAEYVVKVFRDPGAAPTCTAFTVSISNG